MKILIYGAGAIGGCLGVRLCDAGHDVVLVARPTAVDAIAESGLTLKDASGRTIKVQPQAVTTLRQALALGEEVPFDYLFLTMKAYDVPAAINELLAYCPESPPMLVPFQNGIGTEEKLSEHYAEELILSATFNTPVSVGVNNTITEQSRDGGIALSSMVANQVPKDLVNGLRNAGFNVLAVKDYQSMKWSKLMITVMGNATAAIVNRPPDALYKYKPIYQLELRMLKEIQEVMKALGLSVLDLPGAAAKKLQTAIRWVPAGILQGQLTRQVSHGRGHNLPSFQTDLNSGKGKNEVLYHNGAVNQLAQEVGISTPINGALTNILLGLVHEEINWEIYDGKPKELVLAVNEYIRNQRGTS